MSKEIFSSLQSKYWGRDSKDKRATGLKSLKDNRFLVIFELPLIFSYE